MTDELIVTRPLHILVLSALCLAASGCKSVGADHALGMALSRVSHRMVDSVTSLGGTLDRAVYDVRAVVIDVSELPGGAADEIGRVRNAGVLLVDDRSQRLARFIPHTQEIISGMLDSGVSRLASLPGAPSRIGLDVERNAADFRRSIENLPQVLHIDRTLLADDTVPERGVEIVPTGRQRSWLERMIERISF